MSQEQDKPQKVPVVIPALPPAGDVLVLQKLSSPPFPRSGFPLLGILASVYEHVMAVAGRSAPAANQTSISPSPQNASGQA